MAEFKPFIPEDTDLKEFTFPAVLLGVVMAVILGAANAYLGLKVGLTVAATFPAAVVSIAVLRVAGRSVLEENIARTVASVGEALVAGAIFTIPAFVISGVWTKENFWTLEHYIETTAIMLIGGVMGVLFVTLLRRIMVAESDLPFPESVAAAEIHKAGKTEGAGSKYLFSAMVIGGLIKLGTSLHLFAETKEKLIKFGKSVITFYNKENKPVGSFGAEGGILVASPLISPACVGVGYIIGPKLSAIAFSGGLLAWGLFVPLFLYFVGMHIPNVSMEHQPLYIWKFIVRPIAVGGMLVGAIHTLYKMRDQLFGGMKRAITDLKKAATQEEASNRLDKDLNFKWVLLLVAISLVFMAGLYYYFCKQVGGAIVSTLVMAIAGFFFAAVAGYLVGLIGSSNNPISGLTLSTLIIAALLMVAIGVTGKAGIAATLGVAAVVCCICGVAGDMLQDLKVGHILGGTPWKMELGEIFGVIAAALVMFFPLAILNKAYGFGTKDLPAPQAGLMAFLSQGIIGGKMAWLLIMAGMFMSIGLIMIGSPSPMLIAVGMYLPLDTTFAIFIGGIVKWILDLIANRKKIEGGKKTLLENTGVLLASGFIAGEALMGLIIAGLIFFNIHVPQVFKEPSIIVGLGVLVAYSLGLIFVPLNVAQKGENN